MRPIKPNRYSKRSCRGGSSLAEFGPACFVFFLVILFPLINLIAFATGAATVALLTTQCAATASQGPKYQTMLGDMEQLALRIAASGFGQFAKLKPVAGYKGTGTDLYVVVTDVQNGTPYYFGPNTGFNNLVDPSVALFEVECRSKFDVGPFLNMAGMPFIGSIPIVGKPARLTWNCSRVVEHLESLGPVVRGNGDPNTPPPNPPNLPPPQPGGPGPKYPPWTDGTINPS